MGLICKTEASNGIPLSYHRIVSITSVINNQNIIEVASYISRDKRFKEEIKTDENGINYCNTYISTNYFNAPYDSKMDITSAYAYLKTLPEFKNAEDIFE